jgi:hypothetical protein
MKINPQALAEVEEALEQYREEVEKSDLEEGTKRLYLRHADSFVRWLKNEFTPGNK